MADLLRDVLALPESREHGARWAARFAAAPDPLPPLTGQGVDWHTMLWLCMTPRSGSTWLAQLMMRTRALGRPWEHLAPNATAFTRTPARDWPDYLDRLGRSTATPNGVASIKCNLFQAAPLLSRGLMSDPAIQPRWVYLTREDLVSQAISLHRALMTGEWLPGAGRGTVAPDAVEGVPATYDSARITRSIDWLVRMMDGWERVFAALGVQPLRLTYEQLEADPRGTIAAIARLAGATVDAGALDVGTGERQRTQESAEWAARYRAETLDVLAAARRDGLPVAPGGRVMSAVWRAEDAARAARRRLRRR